MQTSYQYFLRFLVLASDIFILLISFFLSLEISNNFNILNNHSLSIELVIFICFAWIFSAGAFKLYCESIIHNLGKVYHATFKSFFLFSFTCLFLFYNKTVNYVQFSLVFFTCAFFSFLLSRVAGTILEKQLEKYYKTRRTIAILGKKDDYPSLTAYFEHHYKFKFAGFLYDDAFFNGNRRALLANHYSQFRIADLLGIKEIFVPFSLVEKFNIVNLNSAANKYCIRLILFSDRNNNLIKSSLQRRSDLELIGVRKEPLNHMRSRILKRVFDIGFSIIIISFLLSWLYPIIALIIKLQSPGPTLFKQLRNGKNNEPFVCFKFRTMKVENYNEKKQARLNDDRLIPIGKFLRKTSLDELPQFFNVLIGNMSVIGPRPHMIDHTKQYQVIIEDYMVRQFLKPGITGWAQINGFRGATIEKYLMEKRVEHDIWYMENWGLMLEIKIIFKTITNMLTGEENAY